MKNTIVFIKGKTLKYSKHFGIVQNPISLQNENKIKWNIQRERPFRAFIALIW